MLYGHSVKPNITVKLSHETSGLSEKIEVELHCQSNVAWETGTSQTEKHRLRADDSESFYY